jgi:hypothetical protein
VDSAVRDRDLLVLVLHLSPSGKALLFRNAAKIFARLCRRFWARRRSRIGAKLRPQLVLITRLSRVGVKLSDFGGLPLYLRGSLEIVSKASLFCDKKDIWSFWLHELDIVISEPKSAFLAKISIIRGIINRIDTTTFLITCKRGIFRSSRDPQARSFRRASVYKVCLG